MSDKQTKGAQGRMIQYTAPTGGVSSGDLVIIRSGTSGLCAVMESDVAAAATGAAQVGHQVKLPKLTTTGNAWSQGDLLYRDATSGSLTNTATGNTLVGAAAQAALLADTTAWVLMNCT